MDRRTFLNCHGQKRKSCLDRIARHSGVRSRKALVNRTVSS